MSFLRRFVIATITCYLASEAGYGLLGQIIIGFTVLFLCDILTDIGLT